MNIVIFAHPIFFESQSMPRFAKMLSSGMCKRGHNVQIWSPDPKVFKFPAPKSFKKWLGYLDQFLLFPLQVKKRLTLCPKDTLFIFSDQALGPWVPLVSNRPHIIHCHDFLAQLSAFNQIPEIKTKWTGKQYQYLIRKGYFKGKNFISVSKKTQEDLHSFLPATPQFSDVVYNGLNQPFSPNDPIKTRSNLTEYLGIDLEKGYLLHVGGNQWYKNRLGVIEIYNAWRSRYKLKLPLLLIGEIPNECLKEKFSKSPFQQDIHFLSGISDEIVRNAYAGATVLLFPSLAEGFGWPIAEAMASGCPVITTNEAPMIEVGDKASFYIPKRPYNNSSATEWAEESARILNKVIHLSSTERKAVVKEGFKNIKRFDSNIALNRIEEIYQYILAKNL